EVKGGNGMKFDIAIAIGLGALCVGIGYVSSRLAGNIEDEFAPRRLVSGWLVSLSAAALVSTGELTWVLVRGRDEIPRFDVFFALIALVGSLGLVLFFAYVVPPIKVASERFRKASVHIAREASVAPFVFLLALGGSALRHTESRSSIERLSPSEAIEFM